MQATAYYRANYKLFLDKDNKVVGYQLDESTMKQSKYNLLIYPSELPTKACKTIILQDLWSTIVYEMDISKENISNEQATVISYKINESTSAINELIKNNSTHITYIKKHGDICPAFLPTEKEYKDRDDCEHCCNKYQCFVNH